jgi:flagellar biosynthesis/type III secretory pathway chaperone
MSEQAETTSGEMVQTSMLQLPEIEISDMIQVDEIITVTERLTDVLREESDYLKTMQIRKVGVLQEEKLKLISWLEAQKKMIALNPDMKDQLDALDREEMGEVVEDFTKAVEENYHQASIARVVNERIVQAVTDALQAREHVNTYTAGGITSAPSRMQSVTFNVNQKA